MNQINKQTTNKKHIKVDVDVMKNLTFIIKSDFFKYNTLILYNNNKNILNDKSNLEKIIQELVLLIEKDYGKLLFPFLSPKCEELLDAYIKSSLDEEENIESINDFKYIKIFEIMKNNSFINRENVSLIYSNFGSLFYDAKEIEENDKRLSKLLKLKELWKIFYTLPPKKINKNKSYFSFIGGKLIFKLKKKYDFSKKGFFIKINFLSNKYIDKALDKIVFLKLNNQIIEVKKYLKKVKDINNIIYMEFRVYQRKIEFYYEIKDKRIVKEDLKYNEIENIEYITILDNYYGQINSIEITLKNKSVDEKTQINLYYPIPSTEKNGLGKIKNIIQKDKDKNVGNNNEENDENDIIDLTTENESDFYKFKIDDNKLIKVNYINYNEDNYNIIEYFGGITQLLPFMSLIKNLFENENIKIINNQNKNDFLISFFNDILIIFINIISYYDEYKLKIYRYFIFFISILSELDFSFFSKADIIIEEMNKLDKGKNEKLKIVIPYLTNFLKLDRNNFINDVRFLIEKYEIFLGTSECFFNQLYNKLMKELFIYNRNWSKKDLFFNLNKKDNKISVKYKQLNYYTKSFQQPFIYPILEINKYYPKFYSFEIDNLFKDKDEKILNYDFSLSDNNIIINEIKNLMTKKENIEFENCCLVKKIYHVKGKMVILKTTEENKESFEIIFISNDDEKDFTCNKDIINQDKQKEFHFQKKLKEKNKNLCYGSIFRCPKKEYNKKIIIKSENILFILIREYFHRVSAIEIFTNNNKSYYFNFSKKFEVKIHKFQFIKYKNENNDNNDNESNINDNDNDEINNDNENNNINDEDSSIVNQSSNNIDIEKTDNQIDNKIILNIIKNKNDFKQIIKRNTLIGFYNKKYKNYLFPLFENKSIEYKNKYLSNYDILNYINLLSNRSYKDLYQYPVFPMFYDIINKKRIMNKHIGLQDLDPQSKSRIDLFNDSYRSALEEYEENNNSQVPLRLFSTHYSNPIYTTNFLIRVFPYSFCCIEMQGDGFDNPNRLFYCIEGVMNNSLNQKSDLRELIPELFYFYELFKNKNSLKLNKLSNQKEINTVKIKAGNDNETDKDIYKYLSIMRNLLEKEEKLNEWIELIFSEKQNRDEKKRLYYAKESSVNFENNEEILKDSIIMDSTDFGLLPFKIYNSKFPVIKKDNIDKLKNYISFMADYDHYVNNYNPMKCCMCIGRTNIDQEYLDIYNNKSKKIAEDYSLLNKMKKIDENTYYFVGDIFGNVTIYTLVKENNIVVKKKSLLKRLFTKKKLPDISQSNENEKSKIDVNYYDKSINNWVQIIEGDKDILKKYNAKIDRISEDNIIKVTIFKKLYEHTKQVKYIDFNGRLNLFVTYGLDGFINLYIFPSCKLINSIKITNIVGSQSIFDKVLLISTPFPMIVCINKLLMYIFDINGNFIHVESIADFGEVQIHIDKNCGIVQDYITRNGKDYSFPFIDEIKNNSES